MNEQELIKQLTYQLGCAKQLYFEESHRLSMDEM